MAQYAKIKTDAVIFNPINAIPDTNSLYVDTTLGDKLVSEAPTAFGSTDLLLKQMQAAEPIRLGKQVSKRADGKIVEAESDAAGRQQPIGVATIEFANADDLGNVLLPAPNAAGVLAGLGFTPGREIFIGETTGGYVDDITPFVDNDDSLIKVGVADCAAGVASGTATDLIMITQVIARP